MNAYRVHYTYYSDEEHPQLYTSFLHVAARTREEAIYKIFDELADDDSAHMLESFSAVYIQEGHQWLIVHPHNTLAGV